MLGLKEKLDQPINTALKAIIDEDLQKKYVLKTPSDLKFVNELMLKSNYDLPIFENKFYHGVHQQIDKTNKEEIIVGLLEINQEYGWLELRDNIGSIAVKLYKCNQNLDVVVHQVVFIKNWKVISEVYEFEREPTLSYLMVHFEDIIPVRCPGFFQPTAQKILIPKGETFEDTSEKISYVFRILKKSEAVFGYNKQVEIWMKVQVLETNGKKCNTIDYFIFPSMFVPFNLFLNENACYTMWSSKLPVRLKLDDYSELYGLRDGKGLFRVNDDAVLQEVEDNFPAARKEPFFNNFDELKKFVARCGGNASISFALKVSQKMLKQQKWPPRAVERHNRKRHFGNPGFDQQVQISFRNTDGGVFFLDLYMTERENVVLPLGLLPEALVLVQHAVVKKHYIRTNVLTSFQLLDYDLKMEYASASLLMESRSLWEWQRSAYPSLVSSWKWLPSHCVVLGQLLIIAVCELKILCFCASCRRSWDSSALIRCSECGSSDKDFTLYMMLLVQSGQGMCFKVESDLIDLLYYIFDLRSELVENALKRQLLRHGPFHFDFLTEEVDEELESSRKVLKNRCKESESRKLADEIISLINDHINYNCLRQMMALMLRSSSQKDNESIPFKIIDFYNMLN